MPGGGLGFRLLSPVVPRKGVQQVPRGVVPQSGAFPCLLSSPAAPRGSLRGDLAGSEQRGGLTRPPPGRAVAGSRLEVDTAGSPGSPLCQALDEGSSGRPFRRAEAQLQRGLDLHSRPLTPQLLPSRAVAGQGAFSLSSGKTFLCGGGLGSSAAPLSQSRRPLNRPGQPRGVHQDGPACYCNNRAPRSVAYPTEG